MRDGHSIRSSAFLMIMNRASDDHFNGGCGARAARLTPDRKVGSSTSLPSFFRCAHRKYECREVFVSKRSDLESDALAVSTRMPTPHNRAYM